MPRVAWQLLLHVLGVQVATILMLLVLKHPCDGLTQGESLFPTSPAAHTQLCPSDPLAAPEDSSSRETERQRAKGVCKDGHGCGQNDEPPNSYVKALPPSVTMFGDGDFKR